MSLAAVSASIAPIVTKAIAEGVFPGAVIEAGRSDGPLVRFMAGRQTYDAAATAVDGDTIRSRAPSAGDSMRCSKPVIQAGFSRS